MRAADVVYSSDLITKMHQSQGELNDTIQLKIKFMQDVIERIYAADIENTMPDIYSRKKLTSSELIAKVKTRVEEEVNH